MQAGLLPIHCSVLRSICDYDMSVENVSQSLTEWPIWQNVFLAWDEAEEAEGGFGEPSM